MSCDDKNKQTKTKKRILFFSIIGGGIGITAIFLLSNTNNNNNLAIILPFLASFAICPAMCAMIGGGIWITNRLFGKDKQVNKLQRRIFQT